MVEIRAHSTRELQPERKVCGGCQSILQKSVFQEPFHIKGCRRRLIPGLIPTIWKIDPGKQSSKRQHRKVSLV